jgi:superfamily II DNA or RNA helicase
MLPVENLPEITTVGLPPRFDVDLSIGGLQLRRLVHPAIDLEATVGAFRSRGANCRRVLAADAEARETVIEFGSFRDKYDPLITGVVRARSGTIDGGRLDLEGARFRDISKDLDETAGIRDEIHTEWAGGIRYRREIVDEDGDVIQRGLRLPQLGAMHAVASHWTLGGDPAMVVMPTGTGKTEVMIAATIAAQCERVLVIVPTDALRQQTADKFSTYGLLERIGIIDAMTNPVVATLSSRPAREHFDAIRACNVLVTTMSSIGLADASVQQEFAALFSHIFFDEAHHIEAATWRRFRAYCADAHTLLFTATPFREDSKQIEGKIIYNFPLSAAQEQGYFGSIRFVEVFEPNAAHAHPRIAEAAVAQLREDIAAGHDHIMMARTSSIAAARQLYEQIYAAEYADLNPVLFHSQSRQKRETLQRIRAGEHEIIVCVDMFGEGFDLPNLKIAALHAVHKSIGVTLQFVGRFARTREGVAGATFIANVADDGVPEALENLYQEDPDWGLILADLSYDAIDPQAKLSALAANLRNVAGDEELLEISTLALRPKISAQVYRTDGFHPERYANAFRKNQHICQPQISHQDNLLVLVVNQRESLDWTDSRDIETDSWHLYIANYDPQRQLLYCHSSKKGNATEGLAKAISDDPVLISGEDVFKTFARLRRLTLHSVGLTSRSKNVRYQMFAGLDVRNAIDPVLQQDKMKSNITGVGYQGGKRRTVGCSRKGKVWSMSSGSLANWKNWCDEIGEKLVNADNDPNDFLRYTLVPSLVGTLPTIPALMADWPDQLFESYNFKFEVLGADGTSFSFHDCELDLVEWPDQGATFRFALRAGEGVENILELTIRPHEGGESTYDVRRIDGPALEVQAIGQRWEIAAFFDANPPLVRLADGSQLSGNILLKPREELADTYARNQIHVLDWTGVDLTIESLWRNGERREHSIQERFIAHLENGLATFIIDDDDTGESADVVALEETAEDITVYLWHCKYSGGAEPGQRVKDLYEVCGQAQKSVKWTWNLNALVKHLIERESDHLRGRPTRFVRGSANELVTLRKAARRKVVKFRIGIVQPGLSRHTAPAAHLAVLGATNSFVQTVTGNPLLVYASDQ